MRQRLKLETHRIRQIQATPLLRRLGWAMKGAGIEDNFFVRKNKKWRSRENFEIVKMCGSIWAGISYEGFSHTGILAADMELAV